MLLVFCYVCRCNPILFGDIVSGTFDDFKPMEAIPTGIYLSVYAGGSEDFMKTPLPALARQVEEGVLKLQIGKVFQLDAIIEAHECMEADQAGGKIVVLT